MAISFNEVIFDTTAVIVGADNLFVQRASKKNIFKIRTGSRETHELCWRKYLVEVTKSSNVSVPEIRTLNKLQKYANNDLFVNDASRIKSVISEICLKEGGDEKPSVAFTDEIIKKTACYLAAL